MGARGWLLPSPTLAPLGTVCPWALRGRPALRCRLGAESLWTVQPGAGGGRMDPWRRESLGEGSESGAGQSGNEPWAGV